MLSYLVLAVVLVVAGFAADGLRNMFVRWGVTKKHKFRLFLLAMCGIPLSIMGTVAFGTLHLDTLAAGCLVLGFAGSALSAYAISKV